MFDVIQSLRGAFAASRERLSIAEDRTARAGAGVSNGARIDSAMAATAREALFTEALMSAAHARLEEIKSVTR